MKKVSELISIAKEYAKTKNNKQTILYDPIFRIENNKLCIAYLVVEFNDEFNNDYRIKRPKEWLIQDIISGEILNYYNVLEKDYTTLPFDKLYTNDGKSILYDQINDITKSFQKWQKQIKNDMSKQFDEYDNSLYDEKVMKIDENIISPRDYILANIDNYFEKMFNILFNEMGGVISDSYNNYYESLFESIRNKYVNENIIDKDLIKKYMNFIKYSWPESLELLNNSSNIDGINDEEYDKTIIKMLKDKNNSKERVKDLLSKIDEKIERLERGGENND